MTNVVIKIKNIFTKDFKQAQNDLICRILNCIDYDVNNEINDRNSFHSIR